MTAAASKSFLYTFGALASGLLVAGCDFHDAAYTLYRSSPADAAMRIHLASFAAKEGAAYNRENCELASRLFRSQEGVTVRWWCEKGRYQKRTRRGRGPFTHPSSRWIANFSKGSPTDLASMHSEGPVPGDDPESAPGATRPIREDGFNFGFPHPFTDISRGFAGRPGLAPLLTSGTSASRRPLQAA